MTVEQHDLKAELGRLEAQYSQKSAEGSFGRRAGVQAHHARVLRQTRAQLTALDGSARERSL